MQSRAKALEGVDLSSSWRHRRWAGSPASRIDNFTKEKEGEKLIDSLGESLHTASPHFDCKTGVDNVREGGPLLTRLIWANTSVKGKKHVGLIISRQCYRWPERALVNRNVQRSVVEIGGAKPRGTSPRRKGAGGNHQKDDKCPGPLDQK